MQDGTWTEVKLCIMKIVYQDGRRGFGPIKEHDPERLNGGGRRNRYPRPAEKSSCSQSTCGRESMITAMIGIICSCFTDTGLDGCAVDDAKNLKQAE
jgi:hypothetical protein